MSNKVLTDVTLEFLEKSTLGKGSITYEDGFDFKRHYQEKQTALWLLDTFGGEIIVLKEKMGYRLKNPDYKWNGKFWELKGVSSNASLENALRKAFKQIKSISGGIIIDISKYSGNLNNLLGIIEKKVS